MHVQLINDGDNKQNKLKKYFNQHLKSEQYREMEL